MPLPSSHWGTSCPSHHPTGGHDAPPPSHVVALSHHPIGGYHAPPVIPLGDIMPVPSSQWGTSCPSHHPTGGHHAPPIIPLGDIMSFPPTCGCFVPFPLGDIMPLNTVWRVSPDTNPIYGSLKVIPFCNMAVWNRKIRRRMLIPTLCGCDRLCWKCGVLRRCERWNGWSGCCTAEVRVAPLYQALRAEPACGYRAACDNKYRQPSRNPFLRGLSQCLVENIN